MDTDKNTQSRAHFEFVEIEAKRSDKKSIEQRKIDFKEIYLPMQQPELKQQASRCLDCGNPYCQWQCPLHNAIPQWLSLAAKGQTLKAAELAHQTNSLPEICGRVCPQDRLCEQACTLNTGFGAVTIGQVEKAIADQALNAGWLPELPTEKLGFKVAIVGAGPAGLSCADKLARVGIEATVFDQQPEIGGLLTFGIPEFKLEKSIIQKRRDYFERMGISFKLNTRVGKDIALAQLEENYDAIFFAMGAYQAVSANVEGSQAKGVYLALDYLIGNTVNLHQWHYPDYPFIDLKDKKVVVLGAGDTAMDCVRTAIRQEAKEVYCVYRRTEEQMPGSKQEFRHACEEGVQFLWRRQASRFLVNESGLIEGIEFEHLDDEEQKVESIEADAILVAYGFRSAPPSWLEPLNLILDTNQELQVSADNAHRKAKIYAGGDMVRGADLVVTAIADGHKAAAAICADLGVFC